MPAGKFLVFTCLLFVVHAAFAFPTLVFEREPNDTLEQAQTFRGEARLVGEVLGEDQDLFWWALDDSETDRLWHFELQGEGAVAAELVWPAESEAPDADSSGTTTFGVAPTAEPEAVPDAEVAGDQSLLTLALSPRDGRQSRDNLLVPAGEHLIRFEAVDGGGAYQFTATAGDRIRIAATAGPDQDHGIAIAPGRQWYYQLSLPEVVIPLALGEKPEQLWRLRLMGELGAPLEAWIEDAHGQVITPAETGSPLQQEWGRLKLPEGSRLHLRHADGADIGRLGVRIRGDGLQATGEADTAPETAPGAAQQAEAVIAGSPQERVWLMPGETFATALETRQARHLAFQVDSATGALAIGVDADDPDAPLAVCLNRLGSDDDAACRTGTAGTLFSQMTLSPGDYALHLLRPGRIGEGAADYTLSLAEDQPAAAGWVSRPNDVGDWALPITPDTAIHGHFEGSGEAWFELQVGREIQQWDFSTEADVPLSGLALFRGNERLAMLETRRTRQSGDQDFWLENVRLLPGRYLLRLRGEDTDYRVLARPLGQPAPGMEFEPNDTPANAGPIWFGEAVQGTFHSRDDKDLFHFNLPGWNRLLLALEPPAGADIKATLSWQGQNLLTGDPMTEPGVIGSLLPPGDYILTLEGRRASRERYRAQLDIEPPWAPSGGAVSLSPEREYAPLLPEDGILAIGMGPGGNREGFVRLPITEQTRELEFQTRSSVERLGLRFDDAQGETLPFRQAETAGTYTLEIPGGKPVHVWMGWVRDGPTITFRDPAAELPATAAIKPRLESETTAVTAFHAFGQRLTSHLTLHNPADEVRQVELASHASHAGVTLNTLPVELELAPGEEVTLPLTWSLPVNLLESPPLALFVRANEQVVRLDVALEPAANPVQPYAVPDVPDALQGLADLAWSALGATFVDADSGEPVDAPSDIGFPEFLLDGMAAVNSSSEARGDIGAALSPIRLAGDGGLVRGIGFNQRSRFPHALRWREVEIALGNSHDDLTVITTVELSSVDGEQFFELQTPRQARYVQLRPLALWAEPRVAPRIHGTGLLRVLAEPAGALADRRHDLLDFDLGGHWVHTQPDIHRLRGLIGQRILWGHHDPTRDKGASSGQPIRGRSIEMVFAFLNQRAARIGELHWIDNLDWAGEPVEQVRVYTATRSATGPWEDQGRWLLERDDAGVSRLDLPETPRTRYLRLVFEEPAPAEGRGGSSWRVPMAVRALEADTLAGGRSILGNWGMDHSRGPLEAGRPTGLTSLAEVDDAASHDAQPVPLEERISGRVREPGDSRHYGLTLEQPDNTLSFTLEESQRGRLQVTLSGADGEPVALSWTTGEAGRRSAEAVGLAPGDYRLKVAEPPRSVVFLWDGSGSVADHQPAIYQALNRFAEGLGPGREVINLLPLGGTLLLDNWAETPVQVSETLAAYDNRFMGSDSEPALQMASRALEQQDGEKVIFLITDAEQVNRDLSVWKDLERVRPRVFALEISHGDRKNTLENRWYQDQMLSWAHAGDGQYAYTTNRSDLIRAFEAGMRQVRQPTAFVLRAERRYQEPPEPGSVRVVSGEVPVVAAGVVHLIFDASGSMLRRMEGGRRIEVAKRIVDEVLDTRIPRGVPVALRAFGHTAPHSCATELLVRPTADNHDQVRQAVRGIQAINLARTPLADSLDAVLEDLEDYPDQRRLVVMLTDGEETCEGDLDASVTALVDSGVGVRLNIVGFHIDEIGLQAEFQRFAERGGGDYFDSQDGDELMAGLASALAARWRVLDSGGVEVGRGRMDDDGIALEVGTYELLVETTAGDVHRAFEITPRDHKIIELGEPP